ncbi:phage upper tail fiber protein [Parapedobacter soli]|uniref:phage upper tail fiber protein n=1 Tax=Parapedobacter soli TaxID=416955 RepID=UPI0021CA15B5|nr:hypothetical protein [Parapedobacter soli]
MITITTTAKTVTIETETFKWNIVKSRIKGQIPFASGTRLVTEMGEIAFRYNEVTGNGEAFGSAEDLQNWIETNCFSVGGGSGAGLQSIQPGPGIDIDDTDPSNPIVSSNFSNPTWDDIDEKPEFMAVGATAAAARAAIGLGSASTRPAGDFDASGSAAAAELAAKNYTDSKVAGIYKFKGSVANYVALPTDDLTAGDVYNLLDTDMNYAWTGTEWDPLGTTVDLSNYYNKSEADGRYATAAQGTLANTAVQPAAIAAMVESKQEEGKGWPIKNYLPITQADYEALAVKDPYTEYAIINQYPTV